MWRVAAVRALLAAALLADARAVSSLADLVNRRSLKQPSSTDGARTTGGSHPGKLIFINGMLDSSSWEHRSLQDCDVPCSTTAAPELLSVADAVVWNPRWMWVFKDAPVVKPAHQRWIFNFFFESSIYNGEQVRASTTRAIGPKVDWTMTYSRRSDFFDPMFRLVPSSSGGSPAAVGKRTTNFAEGKQHMILFLLSNHFCTAKRAQFFRNLQAMLPPGSAHIYGACGDPSPCPGRDESDACYQKFFAQYKFYAAFENTRCEGYITEKFERGLLHGMVPLALGGFSRKDYNMLGVPDSAFAHVDDFTSMEELAEWLRGIDRNDTAYNEFFSWRGQYRLENRTAIAQENLCSVCRTLSDPPSTQKKAHQFGDLGMWWYGQTCLGTREQVPYLSGPEWYSDVL